MFFFFNDTATTEIYTLSLHDALPICRRSATGLGSEEATDEPGSDVETHHQDDQDEGRRPGPLGGELRRHARSEEHTSELQSRQYLVCRLLLEKKKTTPFTRSCRLPRP